MGHAQHARPRPHPGGRGRPQDRRAGRPLPAPRRAPGGGRAPRRPRPRPPGRRALRPPGARPDATGGGRSRALPAGEGRRGGQRTRGHRAGDRPHPRGRARPRPRARRRRLCLQALQPPRAHGAGRRSPAKGGARGGAVAGPAADRARAPPGERRRPGRRAHRLRAGAARRPRPRAGPGGPYETLDRTVDAHIKNLRRKLEPDPSSPIFIETVVGAGYRFAAGTGRAS